MKKLLGLILSLAFVLTVSTAWAATNWPAKAIEEVNPASAGGDTDIMGRLFNRYLEKELGKSVITINMPGGGGAVSVNEVHNSSPNGYKLLTYHNGFLINGIFGLTKVQIEDLEIGSVPVGSALQCWVVRKDAPYNTIRELVEYVRSGKKVNASITTGAFTHMQLLALEKAAGVKFETVDGGNTPEKIANTLGGHIDVMSSAYTPVRDFLTTGALKCIGILSDKRHPALPNVPTFLEQGFDVRFQMFFFHAFPKGTPREIVQKYSNASRNVCKNPEFIKEVESVYGTVLDMGSEEGTEYMKKVRAQYRELAKGISL